MFVQADTRSIAAMIYASILCMLTTAVEAANDATTPFEATSLHGEAVMLEPHPVEGAILVVGFSRRSADQTEAWWERLRAAAELRAGGNLENVRLYNVVVLDGAPGFVRRMVRRAIRGDVPAEQHDSYVVVERDGNRWRELADVQDEDAAHVLRIDPMGRLCTRQSGPASDAALAKAIAETCSR